MLKFHMNCILDEIVCWNVFSPAFCKENENVILLVLKFSILLVTIIRYWKTEPLGWKYRQFIEHCIIYWTWCHKGRWIRWNGNDRKLEDMLPWWWASWDVSFRCLKYDLGTSQTGSCYGGQNVTGGWNKVTSLFCWHSNASCYHQE